MVTNSNSNLHQSNNKTSVYAEGGVTSAMSPPVLSGNTSTNVLGFYNQNAHANSHSNIENPYRNSDYIDNRTTLNERRQTVDVKLNSVGSSSGITGVIPIPSNQTNTVTNT